MAKARQSESLSERLWNRVARGRPGECWLWQGAVSTKGYGMIRFHGKLMQTHRVALEVSGRFCPSAPNNHALHGDTCTSPACCNPSHLRWGSNSENLSDRLRLGRGACGSSHGSAVLSEETVREIRQSDCSASALAKKFGVAEVTIAQARSGRTWKHVA